VSNSNLLSQVGPYEQVFFVAMMELTRTKRYVSMIFLLNEIFRKLLQTRTETNTNTRQVLAKDLVLV